jgi:hypothetical protein
MKCAGRSSAEFEYLQRLVGNSGLLGGLLGQPNSTAFLSSSSSAALSSSCRLTAAAGAYNTTSSSLIDYPLDGTTAVCSPIADAVAAFAASTPTSGGLGANLAVPAAAYSLVEEVLYTRVIPLVCLFGIVGNCLNLFALTSMILAHRTPMDRMERSATVGLLALAVSDLFFCIAVVPLAFVQQVDGQTVPPPDHLTVSLLYQVSSIVRIVRGLAIINRVVF